MKNTVKDFHQNHKIWVWKLLQQPLMHIFIVSSKQKREANTIQYKVHHDEVDLQRGVSGSLLMHTFNEAAPPSTLPMSTQQKASVHSQPSAAPTHSSFSPNWESWCMLQKEFKPSHSNGNLTFSGAKQLCYHYPLLTAKASFQKGLKSCSCPRVRRGQCTALEKYALLRRPFSMPFSMLCST